MEGVQHKAFVKLLGLQYKLAFKKGKDNGAADALSRKSLHEETHAISTSIPIWMEVVIDSYQQDPQCKQLLTELSLSPHNDKGYSLQDGILRCKGRIWLGNHTAAQEAVLLALHASGLGGTVVSLPHTTKPRAYLPGHI
jgi:hypothetical protein